MRSAQSVAETGRRRGAPGVAATRVLQRKCDCGQHTGGGECEECKKKKGNLQRYASTAAATPAVAPPVVHEVLRSPGQALDAPTASFFGSRYGHDFSQVRVHADEKAADSARSVQASAYAVGHQIVFGNKQYSPHTAQGKFLLGHELAHVRQQAADGSGTSSGISIRDDESAEQSADTAAEAAVSGGAAGHVDPRPRDLYRRSAPYIKKITVHLSPKQSADLQWEGTAPSDASGQDHFTVSTGKGYSDPGDPAGTCLRDCCGDPDTQCAPPWNQPGKVGACCTYYGDNFWTGASEAEHGWKWWTPIQPYYSSRAIALHQHTEVTGEPIGHGCVRMDEANAKRIHDFSNGRKTNVTIEGRAAPVKCEDDRKCQGKVPKPPAGEKQGAVGVPARGEAVAGRGAVPGLEGALS